MYAFFGKGQKWSHSLSGAGLKCLTLCLHLGAGKCSISLHVLKWAKHLFGLSTLIDLKSWNLGDLNWSDRSVEVLWEWGREFPLATNKCTHFGGLKISAFRFPGPWKGQGSGGSLDKFWGVRTWSFFMEGIIPELCVPTCLISLMKIIWGEIFYAPLALHIPTLKISN